MSDPTPNRTTDSNTTVREHPDSAVDRRVDEPDVVEEGRGPVDRRVDDPDVVEEQRPLHRTEERWALRIPTFSLLAPIGGWLAAWGAAALTSACLISAGVGLGLGFGIADGSVNLDTGFWAGLWTLVIQIGAFVVGGYVAGRMARVRAFLHAGLAWFIAMAATAADAIVVSVRDSGSSVLGALHLPQWAGLGASYETRVWIPLIIFALGGLVGALIGGSLAAGANRRERDVLRVAAG